MHVLMLLFVCSPAAPLSWDWQGCITRLSVRFQVSCGTRSAAFILTFSSNIFISVPPHAVSSASLISVGNKLIDQCDSGLCTLAPFPLCHPLFTCAAREGHAAIESDSSPTPLFPFGHNQHSTPSDQKDDGKTFHGKKKTRQ